MHGRARMRLIGVINIICFVLCALCLSKLLCDEGLISYYGKVFRVIEFT